MKKNNIIKILLSTICAFVLSLNSSFAMTYSDLQGYKWAEGFIYDVSEKGIVTGYPGGQFKPANGVTRIEVFVMLANLYPKEEIDKTYEQYKSIYQDDLKKMNIDKWAWPYVTFAIKNGVMNPSIKENVPSNLLNYLVNPKTKKQEPAKRYEVAVFLVRALGLGQELNKDAKLSYKDNDKIYKDAVPFIELLQRKGILSTNGDGHGNFKPLNTVTRAETATMISKAYKFSAKAKASSNLPQPNPVETPAPQPVEIQGQIALITYEENGNMIVSIKQTNGSTSNFSNNQNNIKVFRGDREVPKSELAISSDVKLGFTNGKLVKITLPQQEEVINSTIDSFSTADKYVRVNVNDVKYEYKYDQNTVFIVNGQPSSADNLENGAKVELRLNEQKIITKLDATITARQISGVVEDVTRDSITIKEDDGKVTKAQIQKDAGITKNGQRVNDILSIKRRDNIKAVLDNGAIRDIDITVKDGIFRNATVEGVMITSGYMKIEFSDKDKVMHTADVTADTLIRINDKKATINDLKIGLSADITVKDGKVTDLISDGDFRPITVSGEVEKIDIKEKYLEVREGNNKLTKVYYNADTKIEDIKGKAISPEVIYKGDVVTAICTRQGADMLASRLIVDMVV